eukprot:1241663-Prorocentrum_lima.AAC.1
MAPGVGIWSILACLENQDAYPLDHGGEGAGTADIALFCAVGWARDMYGKTKLCDPRWHLQVL